MDISKSRKIGLSIVMAYLHQHLFLSSSFFSLHAKTLWSPTFIIYFHPPDSNTVEEREKALVKISLTGIYREFKNPSGLVLM